MKEERGDHWIDELSRGMLAPRGGFVKGDLDFKEMGISIGHGAEGQIAEISCYDVRALLDWIVDAACEAVPLELRRGELVKRVVREIISSALVPARWHYSSASVVLGVGHSRKFGVCVKLL